MAYDTTPGASGYFMPQPPQSEIEAAKRDVPIALTKSTGLQNWRDWDIDVLVSDLMHEYDHLEPAARWAIHELVQDELLTVNESGILINLVQAKLWEWLRNADKPPLAVVENKAKARNLAQSQLKGGRRRIVEIVCDSDEPVPLSELAVDREINWQPPYEGKWSSAMRGINGVMKVIGIKFRRHDSAVCLETLPKTLMRKPSKTTEKPKRTKRAPKRR